MGERYPARVREPLSLPTTIARFVVGIALFVLLAACGGSDDADVAASDEPTPVEVEPAATDDGDDSEPADDEDAPTATDDDGEDDADEPAAADPVPAGDGSVEDLTAKPPVDAELFGEFNELITTDIVVGDGETAEIGDEIAMQYVGVLASDGTEFDSSWDRGATFDFQLGAGRVITGWDEGIVGMKVGGRRVLQIPSAKAYGPGGSGAVIGPDADLIFIVDLVSIIPPPEPAPPIPEDALGPVDELNTIDLVEGSGPEVARGDILSIQFVIADAESGQEFDSTWARGQDDFRMTAGLSGVISGWSQGVIGMKAGGERIIQIPSSMANDSGDIVMRVHLTERIEAPLAHSQVFDGAAPSEIEVTTLVEGSGDGAEATDIVEAHLAALYWKSGRIVQSTWEFDEVTPLPLSAETSALPGLNENLVGIKVGETRQVVLPATLAFPDGIPEQAQLDDDDAVVFIVEVFSIQGG